MNDHHPPQVPALATAAYLPLMRALVTGLRRHGGVGADAHLVVACSGGRDSVALLRGLALLAGRRGWRLRLTAVHVQHHLRGAAAEGDAAFVAELAEELGVAYLRRDVRPGPLPGNVEANARRLRYAALRQAAESCGANFVATAHHADDQLETLLMAMLRGTTAAGMRGIARRRPLSPGVTLIRPMLDATHDQATAFLGHLDQPWREDATNRDTGRTRARLRRDVLPTLRNLRPDAALKALRLSDAMRELIQATSGSADAAHAADSA